MPTSIGRCDRVRLAHHDRVHRKITPNDLTGLMTQPGRTRVGSSYLWIIPLAFGLVGIVGFAKFRVVMTAWSAIASSTLGTTLFAMILTVGVCGSIASAVFWCVCQQELRSSRSHRAAIRHYLAMHDVQGSNAARRRAA